MHPAELLLTIIGIVVFAIGVEAIFLKAKRMITACLLLLVLIGCMFYHSHRSHRAPVQYRAHINLLDYEQTPSHTSSH